MKIGKAYREAPSALLRWVYETLIPASIELRLLPTPRAGQKIDIAYVKQTFERLFPENFERLFPGTFESLFGATSSRSEEVIKEPLQKALRDRKASPIELAQLPFLFYVLHLELICSVSINFPEELDPNHPIFEKYSNLIFDRTQAQFLEAFEQILLWSGTVNGIAISRSLSTAKATAARRTQGQKRRSAMLQASMNHTEKSVRQAAFAVANELKCDPEHVRRTLMATYTKEEWERLRLEVEASGVKSSKAGN